MLSCEPTCSKGFVVEDKKGDSGDMFKEITLPLTKEVTENLQIGDCVWVTGCMYTARDAAHKQMMEEYHQGKGFPFDLRGSTLYYLGPSPARENQVIGSAGPTTSSRMDKYTPLLLEQGLLGMIGKGKRSTEVIDAIVQNKAVYFAAIGGAGALLSKCITDVEVIAYEELGTEAIRKITVSKLPVIVVIDSKGNNLYEIAPKKYMK